jgi:hypothetical protein
MPYIFTYYNPDNSIRFQHQLATERCIGTSKTNQRCRRLVTIGINQCFQHMSNLKIKSSMIDNAGKGLFAYNKSRPNDAILFKPNDKIVDYLGDRIDNNELNQRYGDHTAPYALKINNNLYIDPATRRGIGSLANKPDNNNPNPLLRQSNAKFSVNARNHTASLKATKNIRNNQEILTSYGRAYVLQDNYTTKYRPPR